MNYQPFLHMNILVSDALLATLPSFIEVLAVCIGAIIALKVCGWWLKSDI